MAAKVAKKKAASATKIKTKSKSKSKLKSKKGTVKKSGGPVCVECETDAKGVSNRIVGRVIRAGQVPRELLVMRMLCESCLMLEDGKRKK